MMKRTAVSYTHLAPGLNLQELWRKADALDDQIESYFDYAFDEKLGYLTCCPTNLGNGMRASVMMHLPGLALTKRLSILDQLGNFGMTVRGLFGEGSQSQGDLYQISNQSTIGQNEQDILTNLKSVAQQIIKDVYKRQVQPTIFSICDCDNDILPSSRINRAQ